MRMRLGALNGSKTFRFSGGGGGELRHEQSVQEKLRKVNQHNTTCLKESFFKEKLAASGGT